MRLRQVRPFSGLQGLAFQCVCVVGVGSTGTATTRSRRKCPMGGVCTTPWWQAWEALRKLEEWNGSKESKGA